MVTEISLEDALALKNCIPEMRQTSTVDELQARVGNNYLSLGYLEDNQLVAFKLGYALNQHTFYSWLGAVAPEFRGKGIAKMLLQVQEKWCRENKFDTIEVKSMNQFKPMLSMLLNNGYNITGFTKGNSVTEHKIHFSKQLSLNSLS
ncbi:GNAT family N-acetyltransferase [Planctobacterium marinum]|uniref:N-acetyltransferase n=1 Tax=Planctobacterium marinum TaxID=1631968 RepID=A0AA48KPZ7_9ALTE|nr:N-acetyltransferase [Planctobacterium marinum]